MVNNKSCASTLSCAFTEVFFTVPSMGA
jgi:hypothetical protein